jgi:hypothetical protein
LKKKNLKNFIEFLKNKNLTQKNPEIEEKKNNENDIKNNIDNNQIPKESNIKIVCEKSGKKTEKRTIANDKTKKEENVENSKEIEHETKLLNKQANKNNSIK